MSLLIFGHKNPDTDSICSAISLAYLKNQLGVEAKPYRLGKAQKEVLFALDYFGVEVPELLESAKGQNVCLVDHNEKIQTIDDIEDANLLEIVDHHKVDIQTDAPINIRVMTVGCTCTIVYNLFKENNVLVTKHIAGLLLSAILSDTLIFKSPTTTQMDKDACCELQKIAQVDMESYAMEMFKAGSSLDEYSISEIINMDFKEFEMGSKKVGIGQVLTLDIDSILSKKEEFLNEMNEMTQDYVILAITDIINEGSYLLYRCDEEVISKAFDVDASQGVFAKGVVSRKKQLVPNLIPVVK